jgi:hypothetical protein
MNRAFVALCLLVAGVAPIRAEVATPPAVRCQAAKIWIAGRYVARHPRCLTAACGAGWTQRLRRSFADLERRLSCITRDDATRVQNLTREFETTLAAMLRRRDRPCARLFVAATARMAGVSIRSQRPVWPPQDRQFSDERRHAFDRFERDRVAAKVLRGCRSVILGSKLDWPATLVQYDVVKALLPPEVATGIRIELPAGWHLHDVAPGNATFVTFVEYGHGGIMPEGGADLSILVSHDSVDDWTARWRDDEPVEHITVDGVNAVRMATKPDDERQRRVNVLVPGERFGIVLSFSWYGGDDTEPQHLNDFEGLVRTARFFDRGRDQSPVTPSSVPAAARARAPR